MKTKTKKTKKHQTKKEEKVEKVEPIAAAANNREEGVSGTQVVNPWYKHIFSAALYFAKHCSIWIRMKIRPSTAIIYSTTQ